MQADLAPSHSEQQAVDILRAHAGTPPPGEWLTGHGWAHNLWTGAALPSAPSLDAVFPANPVFLSSKCGHLGWANSAALAAAGIDASTPNPAGGEIEHDPATGRPTGILKENALTLVERCIPPPTEERRRRAFAQGQQAAFAMGLTGVHAPESADDFAFLQKMNAEGSLRMRVGFMIPVSTLDAARELKLGPGLGDRRLRIIAVKMFADGSLGGRTALMYEGYDGEPGNLGIETMTETDIEQACLGANNLGLPAAVHAIGDKAVGRVLGVFQRVATARAAAGGAHVSNRIEHLQLVAERDLDLVRQVRPVASMQPVHLCADMGPADRWWGGRARRAYAIATLARAECVMAFGSDGPVEPINPFFGMFAATTRQALDCTPPEGWYPEERVSAAAALAAYTIGPALASGAASWSGTLAPGKVADFVVLPEDPTTAPPAALRDMKPLATIVGGETVHTSEDWTVTHG